MTSSSTFSSSILTAASCGTAHATSKEKSSSEVLYLDLILNIFTAINVVGNWRMPVLGDLNERAISLEEIREAVNEMRSGKAPGLD